MAAASYLLLIPHYLPGGLAPAGTTVTEGVQIPAGWVPTMAVDPQNTEAIQAFWNAGPLPDAEPNRDLYWSASPLPAVVYWSAVPGVSNYFVLTGAGAVLGTKNAPTPLASVAPPVVKPSTPVLNWTSDVNTLSPQGTVQLGNNVLTGDVITSLIQMAGVTVVNNVHTITAAEDLANEVDFNNPVLSPGTYSWSVKINHNGVDSDWSNTVTKTLAAFTPAALSPVAWFEPAQGGMFQSNAGSGAPAAANNAVIGFLPDLSGAAFNLASAANDTTRPTLQGVGAFPYVSFDGSNDALLRSASLGSIVAGAFTYGWCIRGVSAAANAESMAEGNSAQTNTIFGNLIVYGTTPANATALWRSDTGSTGTANGNGVPNIANVWDGNDHVMVMTWDGTTASWYKDGVLAQSFALAIPSGGMTMNRFALGAISRTTVGSFWAGRVYGVVCANSAVSASDRAKLTTYLGNLAGLSL